MDISVRVGGIAARNVAKQTFSTIPTAASFSVNGYTERASDNVPYRQIAVVVMNFSMRQLAAVYAIRQCADAAGSQIRAQVAAH